MIDLWSPIVCGTLFALIVTVVSFHAMGFGYPERSYVLLAISLVGLVVVIAVLILGGHSEIVVNQTVNATPAITCTWTNNSTASVLICPR